mgnify:CR=1 FL=1
MSIKAHRSNRIPSIIIEVKKCRLSEGFDCHGEITIIMTYSLTHYFSGGHRFAKVALASVEHQSTPPGSPRSQRGSGTPQGERAQFPGRQSPNTRRRPPRGSESSSSVGSQSITGSQRPGRSGAQPNESYNQAYLDKSIDRDSQRPNPDYMDRSPASRPNVPYPGKQYDIYASSSDGEQRI